MRIILTENVPNLGSLGDEVTVKDGYARNFLLPRGLAITAGGRKGRQLAHQRQYLDRLREQAAEEARSEAEKVQALDLVVTARSGPGGKLFGSVTNRQLEALLAEHGYDVDRKGIQIHTQVKSLGTYTATVKLHTDVKVDVEFRVEPEAEVTGEAIEGEAPVEEAPPSALEADEERDVEAEASREVTGEVGESAEVAAAEREQAAEAAASSAATGTGEGQPERAEESPAEEPGA